MFQSARFSLPVLCAFSISRSGTPCTLLKRSRLKNSAMSLYFSRDQAIHQASANLNHVSKNNDKSRADSNSKFMTVPNVLTSSRILLTPAIGYYIWHEMHSHALMWFTVAAVTDLLDGLIARHFNQSSRVGAILDPIADKFLLTTCFIALHHANLMPYWLVGGFIGRDLALLLGGAILRYRSFDDHAPSVTQFCDFNSYPASHQFEPTFVSKCNTALQCLLIVTHLATHNQTGLAAYDLSILALHALTATTTMVSMGQYAIRASKLVDKSKST